jgi:hypothetical protein
VDATDEPARWPLHQRLVGVLIRTAAMTLAFVPAALYVGVLAEGLEVGALYVVFAAVVSFCLLAPERRDDPSVLPLLRLVGSGVLAAVLVPVAYVSVTNVGSPEGSYAEVQRLLDRPSALLETVVTCAVVAPLLGALFLVRARTRRLAPQVVGATATVLVLVVTRPRSGQQDLPSLDLLVLAATAGLVPVALVLTERWTVRLDPRAPRPGEVDPRPTLAACAFALLLVSFVPGLMRSFRLRARSSAGTHDSTASLYLPMVDMQIGHLLKDPATRPRSLGELPDDDRLWTGLFQRHAVRLVTSPDGERWAVAVDRLGHCQEPVISGARDHTGRSVGYRRPRAIDPETCLAPYARADGP